MSEVLVSIVTPVFNRNEEILGLLQQLGDQTYPNFEIIIVDDCSDVAVLDSIDPSRYRFRTDVVRLDKRSGIARGRNVGVGHAHGELVVFLDSDSVVMDQNWLATHVSVHRGGTVLPGVRAGDLCVIHGKVQGIHSTYAGQCDGYSTWSVSCHDHARALTSHHIPANNTSVSKRVFELVGMFDEELAVLEDVDWSYRCVRHGVKLVYLPGMPVGHVDRDSFAGLWEHFNTFGQYTLEVRKRNPDAPFNILFPTTRLQGWFFFLPLTCMMTLYTVKQWLLTDPRVVFYIPGLYATSVAYYCGVLTYLKTSAREKPGLGGGGEL